MQDLSPPIATPSSLLDALTSTCRRLAASLDDPDARASTLSARGQALAVVDLMRQVTSQSAVDASAVDFAEAAQWLASWYAEQHAAAVQVGASSSPLLLGADGKLVGQAASHSLPPQLVEGLARGASVWGEVVHILATDGGHLDMLKRYETWSAQDAEEPETEMLEYFGATAPLPATYHGAMRIWTHIVAALATMLYGGGARSRQEAVALAMMLGQLSREAAAMAQGLVGEATTAENSIDALVATLQAMPEDDRVDVLRSFCRSCGGEAGCQCWNDE